MSTTNIPSHFETLPAPVLPPRTSKNEKWEREYAAFLEMLPSLLKTHLGRVVAVHNGNVVMEGDDVVDVALRAYKEHGYVPIYVGPVSTKPTVERLPIRRSL